MPTLANLAASDHRGWAAYPKYSVIITNIEIYKLGTKYVSISADNSDFSSLKVYLPWKLPWKLLPRTE